MDTADIKKTEVWLLEDEQDLSTYFRHFFSLEGFAVETFEDPVKFFAKLKVSHPDVLVIDLMLHNKWSGFDVLKWIQQWDGRAIPIIVVSARDETSTRSLAAKLGSRFFLAKPYDAMELARAIRQLTGQN